MQFAFHAVHTIRLLATTPGADGADVTVDVTVEPDGAAATPGITPTTAGRSFLAWAMAHLACAFALLAIVLVLACAPRVRAAIRRPSLDAPINAA